MKYRGLVFVCRVANNSGVGKHIAISVAAGGIEADVELWPGYAGLKDYILLRVHKCDNCLSRCEVEALGHAHTEVTRTLVVEFADGGHELVMGRAVVGAVAGEGYYVCGVIHGAKITKLR